MSIRARVLGLLVLALGATVVVPMSANAAAAPVPAASSVVPAAQCAGPLAAKTEFTTVDAVVPSVVDALANDCVGAATVNRPLTISAVGQGNYGTVSTDGTSIFYDPKACATGDGSGFDFFSYTITDGVSSKTGLAYVTYRRPTPNPVSDTPQVGFVTNAVIGATVPLKVSWCGVSPSGSTVKSYRLEQGTNGGLTFPSVVTAATTAASSTRSATPNTSYAWRVSTTDSLNRTGAPASSLTSRVTLFQESSTAIKYSTGWANASSSKYSGGRERYTSKKNATATLTVTNARAVAIVASRGAGRGSFHVYVDGVRVTSAAISQRTSKATWRQVLYVRGLTSGAGVTHKVQVRAVGNGRVDLDAFLALTGKRDQAVTFSTTAPTDAMYKGATYPVAASSDSGLPVNLSVPSSSWTACSLVAGVVTFHGAGTCRINAAQPGDLSWNARTTTQTFTVARRPVTVTGITALDRQYNGTTAATLDVSGATLDPGDILAGDTVNLTAGGATGAFADRSVGDDKTVTVSGLALGGASAAFYVVDPPTTTASIDPRDLTVSFTTANRPYDGTTDATIATCTLATVVAGDTVTCDHAGATASFADADAGAAKPVTGSGFALAGADAANYALATVNASSATISKASQTITFDLSGVSAEYGDAPVTVSASASSGLAVGFASQTAAVCTVAGDDVTIVAAGTCTIRSSQAGDANHLAAPNVDRSFTVTKRPIHVTGVTAQDREYTGGTAATLDVSGADLVAADIVGSDVLTLNTGAATGAFTPNGNAGSGKTVAVAGLTLGGADAVNYALVQPTTTATIDPRGLTVSFVTPNRPYDGTSDASITSCSLATVVGGDDVTCDDSGATASFATASVGAGKTVTGSGFALAGSDAGNYEIETVNTTTASITVASQSISFDLSGVDATYGDDPVTVSASATSGLSVGFASQTTAVCTVSGDDVTIVTSGTCTIRASQPGNANYQAAPNADRSFVVAKRLITVTAVTDTKTADGTQSSTGEPTITSGTLASGDVGTFGQVFNSAAAGTGKTLTPSGTIAHGATNVTSSYTITFVAVTTGVIEPGPVSTTTSTVVAAPASIQNDGVDTATVTVQLKDAFGNNLLASSGTVDINADHGSVGTVTDNGDGTYTATYTSDLFNGFVTVSATLDGSPLTQTDQIHQH